MRFLKTITTIVALLFFAVRLQAQERGFNLVVVGDPQPQTEAQLAELEALVEYIADVVEQYEDSGLSTAILLTGDNVWDTMAFMPRVKELFESLGVPLYAVIGNHDHDRAVVGNEPLAESCYEMVFGSRYHTFELGDTQFFTLDNINYHSYEDYSIGVSREQMRWLRRVARTLPKDKHVAIAMHAPAVDFRDGKRPYSYVRKIMRIFDGHRIDFITGHRHRHATVDVAEDVIEHSVAQVGGNLWFAPLCTDGMPRSVFCVEERDGEWRWHYRILDERPDNNIVVWDEGEVYGHEEYVVVKVVGWDDMWRIEWLEDGENRGAMEQIEIADPDYVRYVEEEADYDERIMSRLRRSTAVSNHYFRCHRTHENSEITIVATDRFGRNFEVVVD